MRWNQCMHDRQASEHRQRDQYDGFAGLLRDMKRNRHQQKKANFEEDGKPDQQSGQQHCKRQPFLAEPTHHGFSYALRAARLGQHLAQHRSQHDDDRRVSQHRADACLKRLHRAEQ